MPEKYVICPKCQTKVSVAYRVGRKPLNIGVKNILDTLASIHSINETAKLLNCSRGHIYGVLKAEGLTVKEVLGGGKNE